MVAPAQFAQALATDEHVLDIGHTDLVTADGSSFVHRKDMLTERAGEEFLISEEFMAKNQLFFFLHVWPRPFHDRHDCQDTDEVGEGVGSRPRSVARRTSSIKMVNSPSRRKMRRVGMSSRSANCVIAR